MSLGSSVQGLSQAGHKILSDVVLNQVLVQFSEDAEENEYVIRKIQEDGTCWAGGTEWIDLRGSESLATDRRQ